MRKPLDHGKVFFSFLLLLVLDSRADVGTATYYGPPYVPTACFGDDTSHFPASNLFAAAGAGIWDNGASCGREYAVRCLSSATRGACNAGAPVVTVTVVDRADTLKSQPSAPGATLVLSETAFRMIADKSSAAEINVEFKEVS